MRYDPANVERLAKEIAKESSIREEKINYVEKDIWLTYILRHIYNIENAANELVFKGGTCIIKCHYSHYRFSEDLDFTWIGKKESKKSNRKYFKEKYINKLISDLHLGLEKTSQIKEGVKHSHSGKILNYFFILPVAEARAQELKVKITISFDEVLEFPIKRERVKSFSITLDQKRELIGYFSEVAKEYFDEFSIPVYSKEEIACEKVRALLTRKEKINRSRDIIDLFYLSKDVDLEKIVLCEGCKRKIQRSLEIPTYKEVFKQRMEEIDAYLKNIIEYTKEEPVYIKEIDYNQLHRFAMEKLKPILIQLTM